MFLFFNFKNPWPLTDDSLLGPGGLEPSELGEEAEGESQRSDSGSEEDPGLSAEETQRPAEGHAGQFPTAHDEPLGRINAFFFVPPLVFCNSKVRKFPSECLRASVVQREHLHHVSSPRRTLMVFMWATRPTEWDQSFWVHCDFNTHTFQEASERRAKCLRNQNLGCRHSDHKYNLVTSSDNNKCFYLLFWGLKGDLWVCTSKQQRQRNNKEIVS